MLMCLKKLKIILLLWYCCNFVILNLLGTYGKFVKLCVVILLSD